ncbi:MAG TPA: hypothetical protein VMT22_04720, partial [Terriglobales bacterium]|nr:hypothetical protein [Terriglobales bacterium]
MKHVQLMGHSFLWLVSAVSMMLWSGCSLRMPLQSEVFDPIGRGKPATHENDVVIGVPYGATNSVAAEYAIALRAAIGARLVIAGGSGATPFTTVSSSTHSIATRSQAENFLPKGPPPSFKSVLRSAVAAPVEFYIGIETDSRRGALTNIEITATGMTAEQLAALQASY